MGRMVEVHSSEVGKPTTSHSPFFPLQYVTSQDRMKLVACAILT